MAATRVEKGEDGGGDPGRESAVAGGIGGGSGGGCRGRGCRATCDAVTSANRPLLTPPRSFLTLRHPPLSLFVPFRAAHEPHPRDRTRPPNYGLEFELAVNPFIALPPPPARQPPDRLTTTLGHPLPPLLRAPPHATGFSPVTYTHRAAVRRRHVARCVGVQCTVWRGRYMRAVCTPLST